MSNLSDALSSGGSNKKEIAKEINSNLSLGFAIYAEELKRHNKVEILPPKSGIFFHNNNLHWGGEILPAEYLPEGSVNSVLDFNGMSYGCPVLKSGEHLTLLDLEDCPVAKVWWSDWADEIKVESIKEKIEKDRAYAADSRKRAEDKAAAEWAERAERAETFYQKVLLFLKWNDTHLQHKAHVSKLVGKSNIAPTEKHPGVIRWGKYPNHTDCNEAIISYAEKAGVVLTNSRKPIIKKK